MLRGREVQQFKLTNSINEPGITEFLDSDARARIYHHPLWLQSLCDAYGGEPFYLLIKEDEIIQGLAPFILFQKGSSKKVISLPFTNYCDYILPDNVELHTALDNISSQLGPISEFDMRVLSDKPLDQFSYSNDFLVHIIELQPTPEETFKSFGRRSIRRFIKRAEENNLTFRLGNSEEDLKIFYELEVKLRRDIGLPPAPYNFFYCIWSNLKKQEMIFLPIVFAGEEPIAASLVLHYKERIYFEYTGLSKERKDLYGNHKIHWDMIKLAQNDYDVKYVDLGRVSINHTSLIFFKENWGAKPFKVYHKRYPSQKKESLFNMFVESSLPVLKYINKKLPVPLIKLEGRYIYKYLKTFLFCCLFP